MLMGGRFGDPVTDALVLDLFAGTGALGLEALSRGATSVTFVENGRVALGLLAKNIKLCNAQADCKVIRRDATKPGPGTPATLIFLDPPYGKGLGSKALSAAQREGWVAPGATVVWEESHPEPAPEGFALLDSRRYGDTTISILEASP